MAALAPTTDELRALLSERVRQLEKVIRRLDRAIEQSEADLLAIAADAETMTAERIKALDKANRSMHTRADAARKELAAAQRLLRVELPTPMDPGAFAAAAARGSLRLVAYVNAKGKVITDSDCGGWTMKTPKGIVDSTGDIHPLDNDAQTVAEIITNEAGATVTAEDVRALWAILAMVG